MKLLIVEDEIALARSVEQYLKQEGHLCESAHNFSDASDKLAFYEYDCAIVDINLPDGSGLDLIRNIKKEKKQMGIVIVSARNSLENRIEGIEIGADNYLTKPFHLAELNAVIKSVHRRMKFEGRNEIVYRELKLLPDEYRLFVNDKELILTRKEFELLQFFLSNKDKVITKTGLAEHLWGDYMDTADSYDFIYTHIKNLRKKLLKNSVNDYIKTVYGIGYKFDTNAE